MQILITGGFGFLGSVIVEQLLQKNKELGIEKITILDSILFKESSPLPILRSPKVNLVIGDVRNRELLSKLVKESNVIFALAALVGGPISIKMPQESWDINTGHIQTIVDNMNPDTKLLYPCTNSVYGDTGGIVSESSKIKCISIYAQSKFAGEELVLKNQGVSLRLATLAGISYKQRRDLLVNNMVFRALSDSFVILYQPNAMRCYISVNDAASAFIYALENYNKFKGEAFNCGNTDLNSSKIKLAEKIKQYIPNFLIHTENYMSDIDARDYCVLNSKLEATGFKCLEDFDTIIPQVIKGYRVLLDTENYMLT